MWCAGFDPSQVACFEDLLQYVVRTERGYECPCGGFSHKSKSTVQCHVESKHFPNHFVWNCSICGKQAKTKTALLKHKSQFHTKQSWFDCIVMSIRLRLNKTHLSFGESIAYIKMFLIWGDVRSTATLHVSSVLKALTQKIIWWPLGKSRKAYNVFLKAIFSGFRMSLFWKIGVLFGVLFSCLGQHKRWPRHLLIKWVGDTFWLKLW